MTDSASRPRLRRRVFCWSTAAGGLLAGPWSAPEPFPSTGSGDFAAPLRTLLDSAGAASPWAVVVDAQQVLDLGGSGSAFPWSWVGQARDWGKLAGWPRLVLAGGATPDKVAEAPRTVSPFWVYVNSGVESKPGPKDHDKLRRSAEAARIAAGSAGPVEEPG